MILQTTELSPNQKADLEHTLGSKLQGQENGVLCGGTPKDSQKTDRQHAAEQMRYQLYLLDRSQHRLSIEDCMAAMLEQSANKLPA